MSTALTLVFTGMFVVIVTTIAIFFGPKETPGPNKTEQVEGRLQSRGVYIPWYSGPLAFLLRFVGLAVVVAGLLWLLLAL